MIPLSVSAWSMLLARLEAGPNTPGAVLRPAAWARAAETKVGEPERAKAKINKRLVK